MISFFVILGKIPGGWEHVWRWPARRTNSRMFDFRFSHVGGVLHPALQLLGGRSSAAVSLPPASHGTEQLMVQRLLAARSQGESRAALFGSWIVIFFQFGLFLLIG